MSEWNHSPAAGKPGLKQKSGLILAGAAAALLAAGVIFQFVRAQPGQAEVQKQAKPGAAAPAASTQRPQHLARVGDDLISYDQVAAECVARCGEKVLDDLINRTIVQQACRKRGIVVTAEEVDAEIKRIADEFNLPVDTYLQMIQSEREVTPGTFRRDLVWPKLALQKLAGEEVAVTDADMQKAFESAYGPKVKARWIMLDNQRRAKEIWERARTNPEEFEKLAQEFSTDPNSRPMGGQIPPISRHMGNKTLEDAAFKMKEGEVSGIIQVGPSQYVILLCEGQTEQLVELSDVKDYLHDQIVKQKVMEAAGLVLKDLKDTTVVHNFLTNTTTGGEIVPVSATDPSSREHAAAPARPSIPFSPAGPTLPSPKKSAQKTK